MKFRKIFNILNPQPQIGGLEISDSDARFFLIKGKNLFSTSVKLTTGTIENGRVKDKNSFKTALLKLHSQIFSKSKKKIYVILNIPDINAYIQVFNLPSMAPENIDEAAKLNLQMITPIDFSDAYVDWQRVGELKNNGEQIEILGAFIQRQIIDDFVECLKEAGFVITAIEFSSLATARLISGLKNIDRACFLLRLDASGLSFSFIKDLNLYFNHFVPWPASEDRQISVDVLKDLIIRETQKVLNFSSKHWPEAVFDKLFLIAPALDEKISKIIEENFTLKAQKIILSSELKIINDGLSITSNQLPSLAPDWFSALGSAIRGLVPRSKDFMISLASTGTEEEFQQYRIINFIKIWRNVVLTTLIFVLIVFTAFNFFLAERINSLNVQIANFVNQTGEEKFNKIQKEAEYFNKKIELALQAKTQVSSQAPLLEKIKNLAGENIQVDRILIQSLDSPIFFSGWSGNEKLIIDFKNALEKDPEFKEVNLQLSSIVAVSGGLFRFSMTFGYGE